ncbi:hypothetical protein NDU88_003995 [Pleurodeles waltl]|uniref:Uncharacterized protein n=1 Tax=Pleurodeles waltl TaxID=8319 RepID=A0AAV7W401_PLEWA|nr:hypothetical protein NDU88_003995 [Pleurodeles waltl]
MGGWARVHMSGCRGIIDEYSERGVPVRGRPVALRADPSVVLRVFLARGCISSEGKEPWEIVRPGSLARVFISVGCGGGCIVPMCSGWSERPDTSAVRVPRAPLGAGERGVRGSGSTTDSAQCWLTAARLR